MERQLTKGCFVVAAPGGADTLAGCTLGACSNGLPSCLADVRTHEPTTRAGVQTESGPLGAPPPCRLCLALSWSGPAIAQERGRTGLVFPPPSPRPFSGAGPLSRHPRCLAAPAGRALQFGRAPAHAWHDDAAILARARGPLVASQRRGAALADDAPRPHWRCAASLTGAGCVLGVALKRTPTLGRSMGPRSAPQNDAPDRRPKSTPDRS